MSKTLNPTMALDIDSLSPKRESLHQLLDLSAELLQDDLALLRTGLDGLELGSLKLDLNNELTLLGRLELLLGDELLNETENAQLNDLLLSNLTTLRAFEKALLDLQPLLNALGLYSLRLPGSLAEIRDALAKSNSLNMLLDLSAELLQDDLALLRAGLDGLELGSLKLDLNNELTLLGRLELLLGDELLNETEKARLNDLLLSNLTTLRAFEKALLDLQPLLNALGLAARHNGILSSGL